jgi:hypothetical protein
MPNSTAIQASSHNQRFLNTRAKNHASFTFAMVNSRCHAWCTAVRNFRLQERGHVSDRLAQLGQKAFSNGDVRNGSQETIGNRIA